VGGGIKGRNYHKYYHKTRGIGNEEASIPSFNNE